MSEGFVVRRGALSGGGVFAVGGIETVIEQNGLFYRVHTYTDVGESILNVERGGEVEAFVVGGGGGGANGGGGGGGGYTGTWSLTVNTGLLPVVVGRGGDGRPGRSPDGEAAESGGFSQFISSAHRSDGGGGGFRTADLSGRVGGDGGSGGGGGGDGVGGSDGSDGAAGSAALGGVGQGVTTREFASGSGDLYAGGGGAGGATGGAGGAGGGGDGETGSAQGGLPGIGGLGGGGGSSAGSSRPGGNGGSGIVIIRYRITEAEFLAA